MRGGGGKLGEGGGLCAEKSSEALLKYLGHADYRRHMFGQDGSTDRKIRHRSCQDRADINDKIWQTPRAAKLRELIMIAIF